MGCDVVSTSYAEIFVTNKYGVNVAQTNRTSDYYQADEEWWQEATAHPDNLFIEDISFDESAGTYSLNIAAGIFDDDGEVIGAIKVVWNVEEIIDLLGIIEIERRDRKIFGETTHLTLLTHDAQVIYSSRDDLDFLSDARATAVGTVMEKADSETLYTIFSESDETGDVARFVTYARSSGFDTFKGLDWVLVFEQDIDEVLAPVQTTQIIIGGIIASFIVLIFYIVYVYTRHLAAVQHLKEEFISLAAHQLKTPIASNAWAIEVLEDYRDKMPEDAGTWLDTVESNTAVMNRVVKDLLNLSRLESGRFAVEPRDTDIVAEVERMMKESSFSATKNNVTFSLSVDDKVQRTLPLDTSVFQLIFDNVLSNAVKYSPNGGDIKIALTETNTHVQCAVSDTGIGIPQDTQKHIFEKFYRADNTKEHEISGTGLGLYIARLVTRRLGGDMWFTSDENSGTTFFFTIPRAGMKRKKISA